MSIVKNSLNGDTTQVDPAVRRTLYALAQEMDEQSHEWDVRITANAALIENAIAILNEEVKSVRRLLVSLTGTVIVGIIIGIVNIAPKI